MAEGSRRHLEKSKNVVLMDIINYGLPVLKTGNKTATINVKNCILYTLLKATDRKPQKSRKGNVIRTNIDIQAMLVQLTLPFHDFCGFRSVAVNSVYKPQFLHVFLSLLLN